MMPGAGHAPHREKPDETLDAVAPFVDRIFRVHGEALKPLRDLLPAAACPSSEYAL